MASFKLIHVKSVILSNVLQHSFNNLKKFDFNLVIIFSLESPFVIGVTWTVIKKSWKESFSSLPFYFRHSPLCLCINLTPYLSRSLAILDDGEPQKKLSIGTKERIH